jgi:hypothetical protein
MEALAAGVLLSLAIAALASGEIASRRTLLRSVDELEMERTATELLEYLRAQPSSSPAWTASSGGEVPGRPGWVWTITPELVEDRDVRVGFPSFRYLRARILLTTQDGRTLQREALRW